MGLSPAQAKLVLQKDAVNLAQKVADGKLLTDKERESLQAIANAGEPPPDDSGEAAVVGPKFAKNQTQLSEILGVSRKTIERHIKQKDAPKTKSDGRLSVGEWKNYLAAKDVIEADDLDSGALKARNILLQNTILQQRIDRNDGISVLQADVEKDTADLIATTKRILLTGPASLAPQLVGVPIPEAEKLLKEWLHDALSRLCSDPLGRRENKAAEVEVADE
jgi:hypothetical protein